MTNEEKAKEIAEVNKMTYLEMENDGSVYDVDSFSECEDSALDMAKWKDQQFKDAIQKVRSDYMCLDNRSDSAICALDSVLNILKKINNDK